MIAGDLPAGIVVHVSRTGSRAHPDPDCGGLTGESTAVRAGLLRRDLEVCRRCGRGAERRAPLAESLEELGPGDVGDFGGFE